jgi:alcohol dehydrogenase (NADP+)
MEGCVADNLTRGIGVSNFSAKKLRHILDSGTVPPAINQVERHIYLQQPRLLEFCRQNNIHLTCYSPLGSMDRPGLFKAHDEPKPLFDATVQAIAAAASAEESDHSRTPAQVLLQWCIQTGTSTIPKSVNPARLRENLMVVSASLPPLSDDHLRDLNALDRNRRLVDGAFWTGENSPHTLENLWDEE